MTDEEEIARLHPHDRAAEQGVIGALVREPDVLADVRPVVGPEDFYFDAHQRLFRAVEAIAAAGRPVDLVTVYAHVRESGHLDDIGGTAYLAELFEATPTGANATYHAAIVRDKSVLRRLVHAANMIVRDVTRPTGSAAEVVARSQRWVQDAVDAVAGSSGTELIGNAAKAYLARVQARIAAGDALDGLATGYGDLDDILGGLRPGQLIVVGARPSAGKTAIGLNVAYNVASGRDPALIVSLEMPKTEIAGRALAMAAGVPMSHLARGVGLQDDQLSALQWMAGASGLGVVPLHVDDEPDRNPSQVAAIVRRAVRKAGVKLAVIDYLQLMRPEGRGDNRAQQVGEASRRMKLLARECGIPVLCLCQLNRQVELRGGDSRPRLADLRDSGEIEQNADVVLLLHPQPGQPIDSPTWDVDVIVAKQRNGPVGEVTLTYRRPVLRFENRVRG